MTEEQMAIMMAEPMDMMPEDLTATAQAARKDSVS